MAAGTAPARCLLTLAVLAAVACVELGAHPILAGAGAGAATPPIAGPVGPIADWTDDFDDDLEGAEDSLADAQVTVGSAAGPLPEPDRSQVAANLDYVLAIIDRIQDPQQYPSLDPADAGVLSEKYDPQTLPEYAELVGALIRDARDELLSQVVDHDVIGTQLKTIQELITRTSPHSYRSLAGISQ